MSMDVTESQNVPRGRSVPTEPNHKLRLRAWDARQNFWISSRNGYSSITTTEEISR